MEVDIYEESWDIHVHEEGDESEERLAHLHAPDASWSLRFTIPMEMQDLDDEGDIIALMEFRGVAINSLAEIEGQRHSTNLAELAPAVRQFTIISYNIYKAMGEGLLNMVDQVLLDSGIDPPCPLQLVNSGHIRSYGFVMTQTVDDEGNPTEEFPTKGVLYVSFSDRLYRYDDVPAEKINAMMNRYDDEDFSFGQWLSDQIKGTYVHTKLI